MNLAKAAFFDAQVDAPRAAEEYGSEEAPKIRRLLTEGRLHSGLSVLEPGCGTGRLFGQAGFEIDRFVDDALGYFLRARPAAAGMMR
jgi:cyclopropane fatty-acyl-phospholipid synthase-like methyltransferase